MLVRLGPEIVDPEVAAQAELDERELIPEVGERNGRIPVDHDAQAERDPGDEHDHVDHSKGPSAPSRADGRHRSLARFTHADDR